MFKVENADFIADKLAAELLPDQEFREAYKNAEEAIMRRRSAEKDPTPGRIEFDVDWAKLAETGNWFISCADDGDGMNRAEIELYTTTLAVTGANKNQSMTGNQGMGLKISGPTRHRQGVLIRSLKGKQRSMVQIGWNGKEYDLMPLGPKGQVVVSVPESHFPDFIRERGSGTVVTFLGDEPGANSVLPALRPNTWLYKYLHQRLFRVAPQEIVLMVRRPNLDLAEWPRTREAADKGRGFRLAKVEGTADVWDRAGSGPAKERHGIVDLAGDRRAGVSSARVHWWVLPPQEPGTEVARRTTGGGSLAILFQNELLDWRVGGHANPFFARLGVIFGKTRIAFVLEPLGVGVTSDFARSHVLITHQPIFESDSWPIWADQFRELMPEPMRRAIAEEQERLQDDDPDRARRIRERLRDVMQMLRPPGARRRPTEPVATEKPEPPPKGKAGAAKPKADAKDKPAGPAGAKAKPDTPPARPERPPRKAAPTGEDDALSHITPRWVTEAEADEFPIVEASGTGLRDRAAALSGVDGATATDLLLNREFRGYQLILQALNAWGNPDGDETMAAAIDGFTQEWVEQKLVEAVTGVRQLENDSTWTDAGFNAALSPEALTAAFMADRYHTLREVRRQLGPLRQPVLDSAPPA